MRKIKTIILKFQLIKQRFSFWLIIGAVVGILLGITFFSMGAGICLGIGSSAIVTLLVNEYKNDH